MGCLFNGSNNNCTWIIILIIIFLVCGNQGNCGNYTNDCGCNNGCC